MGKMSQIKQEDVHGVVRNSDETHTAVMKDGRRVKLDNCESSSLLNRLDKDRSKMEREGTQASERQREREHESNRSYDPQKRAGEVRERDERLRRELARDPRYGRR
jgi:hypothetical protein